MEILPSFKIFMSNLGYARGINGCLVHHLRYAHRHFYCSEIVQRQTLDQLAAVLLAERPDLCCLVEIDKGSFDTLHFNQLDHLLSDEYPCYDVENKYGENSVLRTLAFTKGKSNAFLSRYTLPYEKIYFTHGTKRLVYKITLEEGLTLFFAHFSLNKQVRKHQLEQTRDLMHHTPGEVMFMGDFNVLNGIEELDPLLEEGLVLLNDRGTPTFTFHKRSLVLDLCLCTPEVAKRTVLRVIPQPYSDHAALLAEIQHG